MPIHSLIKVLVAGSILVPVTIAVNSAANAQQFITKQHILNELQVQQPRVRKTHRNQLIINNGQHRNKKRVVKKRAPTQQFRAPSSNSHVAKRRAPTQQFRAPEANNGQVARRRAPTGNGGQVVIRRAPPGNGQVAERRAPAQQFRAPPGSGQVAKRQPPSVNGGQVAVRRAPTGNNNNVVQRRAPDRNPTQFNQQFASNGDLNNQRAIRLEEKVAAYNANAASVDLEILFEYDSAKINPKSVRQLFVLGEALQDPALGNTRILIAGHTDAAGSNGYNANLSYMRAQSVSDFLINYAGVSPERLEIEGYGEELLKYPDAPNSGQNRRVEIINLGS